MIFLFRKYIFVVNVVLLGMIFEFVGESKKFYFLFSCVNVCFWVFLFVCLLRNKYIVFIESKGKIILRIGSFLNRFW